MSSNLRALNSLSDGLAKVPNHLFIDVRANCLVSASGDSVN